MLLALQRLDEEFDFDISIETLDDVVFHYGGESPGDLFQTKHRVDREASLRDYGQDIWKTLHNWIEEASPDASLTLLTNATAVANSAAALLRSGPGRDLDKALEILERIARTSENQSQQKYYAAFLGLSKDQRRSLLNNVVVLDAQPNILDLEQELSMALRKATTPQYRPALIERLRGWWLQKVVEHLYLVANGERDRISALEIESALLAIAQTLRDDDLPIDYYDMEVPTQGEVASDERLFVEQLRLIALSNERIRQCIHDHNRAFAQRSRWEREKLVHVGELRAYEERLKDEWRRYCLPETDDDSPDDVQASARRRFMRLEKSNLPRIRTHVEAAYVGNGSLHILADRLTIGWHPEWIERLKHLMPELADSAEGAA